MKASGAFLPSEKNNSGLYESKEKLQNNLHDKIQDTTIKILLIQKAINPTADSNAQVSLNCIP